MYDDARKYMQMALNLAKRGIGQVEPNPAVGAIITKANQIIGTGWHKKFGEPHAEINAIEDCKNLGISPQGATMYVTLEPCSHYGKTGPCTRAIIDAGLAKVFIATLDPSEHTIGKGIEQLRNAGIEVHTGICERQARLLNAPFIKFASTGRSWIILKWAQTIDGKVSYARASERKRWISNEKSRADAHRLRKRVQAILVGINTVIADDPLLTIRAGKGKKATRIVLDSFLRTPPDSKLISTINKGPLIIFTSQHTAETNPWIVQQIIRTGAEVLAYPDTHGQSNLHFLLNELSRRGVAQLLVEGGPTVLTSFLKENLADEIHIYISPRILASHGGAQITEPMAQLTREIGLNNVEIKAFGDNVRISGLTDKAIDELKIPPRHEEIEAQVETEVTCEEVL